MSKVKKEGKYTSELRISALKVDADGNHAQHTTFHVTDQALCQEIAELLADAVAEQTDVDAHPKDFDAHKFELDGTSWEEKKKKAEAEKKKSA